MTLRRAKNRTPCIKNLRPPYDSHKHVRRKPYVTMAFLCWHPDSKDPRIDVD